MALEPTFRAASLADTPALTILMDIAGEGIPNRLWHEMAEPGQSALEVGRERARRQEGGFSYRHATLALLGEEIAACLVGYPLDDPYDLASLDDVPKQFQPLVRLEAQAPGSWYVNVLATFPEFRGLGLGTKLLKIAETTAREAGAPACCIIVGSWNDRAARLYQHAGYETTASERAILPPDFSHAGDWLLMIRPLL